MSKQNDFVLNAIVNPTFSLTDFKSVGLTPNNTGIADESSYKSNSIVQDAFKKEDGNFDDTRFHNYYNNALSLYNKFVTNESDNSVLMPKYHRDNIWVSPEQRKLGPDTKLMKIANPNRLNISTTTLGRWDNPTKSVEELAQSQRILLNPTAVANGATPEWGDSLDKGILSSAFWNNLFDTQVLAQWEFDADENGNKVDDPAKAFYHKGEYKLNDEGTYYYEALDGRDVYGKRVLNKANILTAEDSWINKYDFFDSDDIEQKSAVGSVMKQAALVGSMFIPYVGPAIAGLSVAKQSTGLFATLGKMLTGSDSPTLSAIEGWVLSTNFSQARTEEASQHPWCWESFIGLIGDAIGQIREQRVLFQYAPAIFKGKLVKDAAAQEKMEKELFDKYQLLSKGTVKQLLEEGDLGKLAHAGEFKVLNELRAKNDVANFMKSYNSIGELLSKTYMTGITVAGTYGEAKAQGASDIEATMLTLGYGAAEAALLNTGVGEWLYPELRGEGLHQKAVAEALVGVKNETKNLTNKLAKETLKRGEKEAKKEYVKRVFNIGKNTFNDLMGSVGSKSLKGAAASALGEGVEEVSEEILADLSKGCFNLVNYLRGDDTKISTNWRDEEGNLTIADALNDYALNFTGGFVGGGLSSLSIDNLQYMKSMQNMDKNQAMQELIYMVRNNKHEDFLKAVDKLELGNKNLGTKPTVLESGEIIWNEGTTTDNQDLAVKKAIRQQIKLIQDILDSNGLNISDDSFLKGQTDLIQDLKFTYLQNSTTAGRFLQEFNDLSAKIIQLTDEINNSSTTIKSDSAKRKEEMETPKEADTDASMLKEKKEELKKLLEQKDALLKGERAAEFIGDALFEMTPMISGQFIAPTFNRWVEHKTKRKVSDLTEDELNREKAAYETWVNSEKKDDVHTTAEIFYDIVTSAGQVMTKHAEDYINQGKDKFITGLTKLISGNYSNSEDIGAWISQNQAIKEQEDIEVGSLVINQFGDDTDIENYVNQLKILHDNETNPDIDDLTREVNSKKQKEVIRKTIALVALKNIDKIVNPFFVQGFINSELKGHVKNLLTKARSEINSLKASTDEELKTLNFTTPDKTDPSYIAKRDELTNRMIEFENKSKEVDGYINRLDELQHTPIEKNLDEFSLSVLGKPTNLSSLLARINNELSSSKDDITLFKGNSELINEIDEALNVIDLYGVALAAMRTDNGDVSNVVGYAHTLNEVNKRLKTEGYTPIAEIDSSVTDVTTQDLGILKNKLLFAKKLYAIISGLKLSKQNRVSFNKSLIYYDRLRRFIVDIPDDWVGKEELNSVIANCKTLQKYLDGTKDLNVAASDLKKFEQESILIGDAVYDFFNREENKVALTDSGKLSGLIKKLNVFDIPTENLTEDTEYVDDHSFITWLATSAAVKTSAFKRRYASVIEANLKSPNPIAPIATQELAIHTNYASVVNGGVFNTFVDATKIAIKDEFKNIATTDKEKLKDLCINLGLISNDSQFENTRRDGTKEGLYPDLIEGNEDKCLSFLPLIRYSNLVFTEGIAGSGKSLGVYTITLQMLLTFHEDSKILDNVYVIHGADRESNKKSGNGLAKNLGLKEGHYKVLTVDELAKEINEDYTVPKATDRNFDVTSGFEFDEFGQLRGSVELTETSNPPSLIVIDELSNIDSVTTDIIDNYCRKYGISGLVAGDLDQSGVTGTFENPLTKGSIKSDTISLYRTNFLGTPKLGVTMRTANSQKTKNNYRVSEWIRNPKEKLELAYYQDETGIYGDRVFNFLDSESDVALSKNELKESLKDGGKLRKSIDLMISTLGTDSEGNPNKIGYVFNDTPSPLYEYLNTPGIKEHIDFFPGTSAQGREGKYYIIEPDQDLGEEDYLKDFYTALTRSQEGSLVVLTGSKLTEDHKVKENYYNIKSKKDTSTIPEGLDRNAVIKFAQKQLDIWKEIITDDSDITYSKRPSLESEKIPPLDEKESESTEGTDEVDPEPEESEEPEEKPEEPKEPEEFEEDDEDLSIEEELEKVKSILPKGTVFYYTPKKYTFKNTVERVFLGRGKKGIMIECINSKGEKGIISLQSFKEHGSLTDPHKPKPKKTKTPKPKKVTKEEAKSKVDEVISLEETDDKAKKRTLAKEKPVKSKSVEKNNKVKLIGLGYTFNTFGIGVNVNDRNEIVIDDKERHQYRIDFINGLMKIPGLENKSVEEYSMIISDIRSICFTTKDRVDIGQKILKVLELHGAEGLGNLTTDFFLKSTARPNERNRQSGQKYGKTDVDDFSKFDEDVTEQVLGIHTDAERGREIPRKKIILQISTNSKNILEIPLISITNPISIIDNYGANGLYPEVVDLYNQANTLHPDDNKERTLEFFKLMKEKGLDKIHKDLMNLFDLYLETNNDIFEITDGHGKVDKQWTPAKNLKNLGPQIIARETGGVYEQEGFANEADFLPVSQIGIDPVTGIRNPNVKISPIMFSRNSTFSDGSGGFVTNSEGSKYIFQEGHPFVLVSYDKNIKEYELEKVYAQLLRDPSLPKTVKLVYLVSPGLTIEEYINALHKVCSEGVNSALKDIGNDFTTYNIFKKLLSDSNIINYLKTLPDWKRIQPELFKALDEVKALEVESDDPSIQYNALIEQRDKLKENVKIPIITKGEDGTQLRYALSNLLHHLTYSARRKRNNEFIELVKASMEGYTIRYDSKMYDPPRTTSSGFLLVDCSNYSIIGHDGKVRPYLMYGQIDSDMFEVDLESFLPKLKKAENWKVMKYIHNEYFPSKGNTRKKISVKPVVETESDINTNSTKSLLMLIDNIPEIKTNSEINSILNGDMTAWNKLVNVIMQINKSTDHKAFYDKEGRAYIVSNIPNFLANCELSGPIENGLVEFYSIDDFNKYIGTYNPDIKQLEFEIEKEVTVIENGDIIPDEAIPTYKQALSYFFNDDLFPLEELQHIDQNSHPNKIIAELGNALYTDNSENFLKDISEYLKNNGINDKMADNIAIRIREIIDAKDSMDEQLKTKCEIETYKSNVITF